MKAVTGRLKLHNKIRNLEVLQDPFFMVIQSSTIAWFIFRLVFMGVQLNLSR